MKATTVVLVLCAVATTVDGACESDEDCSLNGLCTAGECVCDEGWTTLPEAFDTRECGQLDFLPAKASACGPGCAFHGGAGGIDVATSSWGGNVNKGDDGKFWLLAAEMAQSCTLSHWTTNSQVVAAVSDTAEGPYVRQNIATPPWSHNPEVIRAPDGTWVLYTLGDGAGTGRPWGPEVNCSAMPIPPPTPRAAAGDETTPFKPELSATPACYPHCNFTMHTAPSPRGPWTASVQIIANWTNTTWNLGNWNPAPVMLPDGRVRIMAHTDWAGWAGETILEAPSYKGPYTVKTGDELDACAFCEEDPYMWVDTRGHWHALYHRMFDPAGPLDPNWGKEDGSWNRTGISAVPAPGWAGAHSFSRDGLSGWSPLNRCWNTTMAMADGSHFELSRRERPKLLIQDGVPTHLFNGAIADPAPKGRDGGSITYTAVTPLNVKANTDQ